MRTHPDIGLLLLDVYRLVTTCAFLAVQSISTPGKLRNVLSRTYLNAKPNDSPTELRGLVGSTRAKMNSLINVVNNLLQCCAAPCQQLLLTTIVHSCSRSTTIVQSLLTTINKLFSSTIVSSCSNNIVTTILFSVSIEQLLIEQYASTL